VLAGTVLAALAAAGGGGQGPDVAFSVALPRADGLGNSGATITGVPFRMVWRAADGTVVRTIGPRP
jgi:hypothetical protein